METASSAYLRSVPRKYGGSSVYVERHGLKARFPMQARIVNHHRYHHRLALKTTVSIDYFIRARPPNEGSKAYT